MNDFFNNRTIQVYELVQNIKVLSLYWSLSWLKFPRFSFMSGVEILKLLSEVGGWVTSYWRLLEIISGFYFAVIELMACSQQLQCFLLSV